ncbi:hypothetical protein PF005_g12303 [Phytophthora fragariae]|uniref:Uncharacterized protein n=1 Tax=Phytophthora fragariae TaxID=53985 RepID=A0A6A3U0A6_9STRA|nr:hypothetical protein PF003_g2281 [Phytophthora fragariae]KAE8942176.1 hypothetical protein PF009_g8054 [Phytophthora fragariae]KAE9108120.1 hypothetical protein PF007_g12780 [Phytophthora fragariae]KAE9144596.1 hypothetical protein PF006_g10483 [Phytophthora fragariae]KAE9208210.1 hypothetical protein PF005_g12303 [Phytophthora fragariae]
MSSTRALCSASVALGACIRRLLDLGSGPSGDGVTMVGWGCSRALRTHSGPNGHCVAPLIISVGC